MEALLLTAALGTHLTHTSLLAECNFWKLPRPSFCLKPVSAGGGSNIYFVLLPEEERDVAVGKQRHSQRRAVLTTDRV